MFVSEDADTKEVSDLFFNFAEKYSQDAFIIELESEANEDENGYLPLTEVDDKGFVHYPQIVVKAKDKLTSEQQAEISVSFHENGITSFSINEDGYKISVMSFPCEDMTDEDVIIKFKRNEYHRINEAERKTRRRVDPQGSSLDGEVIVRKSQYIGSTKEGDIESTDRPYDRSDIFKEVSRQAKNARELGVELTSLIEKERSSKLTEAEIKRKEQLFPIVQIPLKETIDSNRAVYDRAKEYVEGIADAAAKKYNGNVSKFPIKRPSRASIKTIRWYGANPNLLGDGSRVNLIVEDDATANKVFKELAEQYAIPYGNRLEFDRNSLGYPKRLMEVMTPEGIYAEIQVMTPEGYLAKEGMVHIDTKSNSPVLIEKAKNRLQEVRDRLGWAIPDGVGHYFYEIHRDPNTPIHLRVVGRNNKGPASAEPLPVEEAKN